MDTNYYDLIQLQEFYYDLCNNFLSNQEIISIIEDLLMQQNFNNYENNFILFLIIEKIKNNKDYDIGDNLLNSLQQKIILSYQLKTRRKRKNVKNDIQQLSQYYKNYTFTPTKKNSFILPEKDEYVELSVINDFLIPNKVYKCYLLIDHNGTVVKQNKTPELIEQFDSYETVYQGLIGQIMEYEKNVENQKSL